MADESVLPWQRAEKPEKRTRLEELLEGQQIARVHYLDKLGPTGSFGLGIELTTGARLIVFTGRSADSKYTALIAFRYLPRPLIVLPRLEKVWRFGMSRDPDAEPPTDLQRYLEGQVVRGVVNHSEPAAKGGEQVEFEFSGGMRLHLIAEPTKKRTHDGLMIADLVYYVTTPEQRLIV